MCRAKLNTILEDWRQERVELHIGLESLGLVTVLSISAEQVLKQIETLEECFNKADAESLRYVFEKIVEKIDLR